jgi:hypothetical protein
VIVTVAHNPPPPLERVLDDGAAPQFHAEEHREIYPGSFSRAR